MTQAARPRSTMRPPPMPRRLYSVDADAEQWKRAANRKGTIVRIAGSVLALLLLCSVAYALRWLIIWQAAALACSTACISYLVNLGMRGEH